MSRKKKTHHHKKGRRVGAAKEGGLMESLALVVGVGFGIIGGRLLNNMVNPATATTTTVSPTILGLAEAGAGGFAASKLKKPGAVNKLIKGLAYGVGGNGLMYSLSSKGLGLLPATIGYGPDPMHSPSRAQLQGFRDVPKIGFPKPNSIGANRDRSRMARQYAGVYGCS
jgi:hypothetical protein